MYYWFIMFYYWQCCYVITGPCAFIFMLQYQVSSFIVLLSWVMSMFCYFSIYIGCNAAYSPCDGHFYICMIKFGHMQNCTVASKPTSVSLALKIVVDKNPLPWDRGQVWHLGYYSLPSLGFPKYPFIGLAECWLPLAEIDPRLVDSQFGMLKTTLSRYHILNKNCNLELRMGWLTKDFILVLKKAEYQAQA